MTKNNMRFLEALNIFLDVYLEKGIQAPPMDEPTPKVIKDLVKKITDKIEKDKYTKTYPYVYTDKRSSEKKGYLTTIDQPFTEEAREKFLKEQKTISFNMVVKALAMSNMSDFRRNLVLGGIERAIGIYGGVFTKRWEEQVEREVEEQEAQKKDSAEEKVGYKDLNPGDSSRINQMMQEVHSWKKGEDSLIKREGAFLIRLKGQENVETKEVVAVTASITLATRLYLGESSEPDVIERFIHLQDAVLREEQL